MKRTARLILGTIPLALCYATTEVAALPPGKAVDASNWPVVRAGTCQGVLVGKRSLLLPAHCLRADAAQTRGAFDVAGPSGRQSQVTLSSCVTHPSASRTSAEFDIAVCRLPERHAGVNVDLATSDSTWIERGASVFVVGIKRTPSAARGDSVRMNTARLRTAFPSTSTALLDLVACHGDSGAPVFGYSTPSRTLTLLGMISGSRLGECSGETSILRVSVVVSWIREQIDLQSR